MKGGGETGKGKSKATAIDLDDSSTDEDDSPPRRSAPPKQVVKVSKNEEVVEVEPSTGPTMNSLSALFGDRAQMERDRLERQKKRQREMLLPEEEQERQLLEPAPKRASISTTSITIERPSNTIRTNQTASAMQSSNSGAFPLYWRGTIKKSYNEFSSMPGTPFSNYLLPTTPFEAKGLTHAVIATFCADIPWLTALFPKGPADSSPEITFICLEESNLRRGVHSPMHPDLPNWVRLVVPKGTSEYTTMHMKFLLLFYSDRLRLMILSGNLVEYDWKMIENTAFIHDFPKLALGKSDTTSDYGKQMKAVLRSLSVPSGHPALKMMSAYDMNSTCEARIVASVPASKLLSGWNEMEKFGLGRLNKVVREILGKNNGRITLEAQGSSMGTYSTRWLQQFHIISTGQDLHGVLPLPSGAKAVKAWAKAVSRKETEAWPPVKLLFPSDRWVKTQSILGTDGAGTFFGKSKQAVEKGFIDIMYQPVSVRGDIMMHHKAVLTLMDGAENEKDSEKVVGWAYMGSHNLTQAAWGNISLSKSGGDPQCGIGNWELGVVMPLRRADLEESQRLKESNRMVANVITWKRPVEKYRSGDIPWDQFNQ